MSIMLRRPTFESRPTDPDWLIKSKWLFILIVHYQSQAEILKFKQIEFYFTEFLPVHILVPTVN